MFARSRRRPAVALRSLFGLRPLALALTLVVPVAIAGCSSSSTPAAQPSQDTKTEPQAKAKAELPACDANGPAPAFAAGRRGVPEVSPDWLATHRCKVHVIDVREMSELVAGRLPFGDHVPLGQVNATVPAKYNVDDPIVFVCRSGSRSARATLAMKQAGFKNVASMVGGMMLWESQGKETKRGPL